MRAWLVAIAATMALAQTLGCDRGVRYRCLVLPSNSQAGEGTTWFAMDVTRVRVDEAFQAAMEMEHDMGRGVLVRCGEVDRGARGSQARSGGGVP